MRFSDDGKVCPRELSVVKRIIVSIAIQSLSSPYADGIANLDELPNGKSSRGDNIGSSGDKRSATES